MTVPRRREPLGSAVLMSEREHCYLVADAVEVDQVDGYEMTRRRVFFSDTEAVTVHDQRRIGLIIFVGLVTALIGTITWLVATRATITTALVVTGLVTLPLLLLFLRLVLVPMRVVQVFGTRTKARMDFTFRVGRGTAVHDRLCALVAAHQQDTRRQTVQQPAAPLPEGASAPATD